MCKKALRIDHAQFQHLKTSYPSSTTRHITHAHAQVKKKLNAFGTTRTTTSHFVIPHTTIVTTASLLSRCDCDRIYQRKHGYFLRNWTFWTSRHQKFYSTRMFKRIWENRHLHVMHEQIDADATVLNVYQSNSLKVIINFLLAGIYSRRVIWL